MWQHRGQDGLSVRTPTVACMERRFRAAIYARISQDRSGAQAGVTRQLEDTRKLAADRGWEVVEEFVDNDVSARQRRWSTSQRRFVNTTRPRYEALLDAIREHRVDAVLAWHPDRLYRRIRDLEDLRKSQRTPGRTRFS